MGLSLEMLDPHGAVYGPEAGGDQAGVVILHGSEGPFAGWAHRFAAILAAQGVLALPWAYGEGDYWGAGPIREVEIKGALDAVEALGAHPRCRGAGLFGWSKGGELALLIASLVEDPATLPFVAAHAASDVVRGAFDPERMRAEGFGGGRDAGEARAWIWPGHEDRLAPGCPIEIARYRGPVFLSTGDADEIADPAMTLHMAADLERAGRPADLFVAPGQGHAYDFGTEPELWARLLKFVGRAV
ncbi:alpha/beta hydrolase family protein [Ovoidimarina sediminis]|uniref:alpha/beta hydrolase family protein n=1 Tax=Ovoidimarina sediminis TaxID=3079856 RepID=UPI00290DAE76|nr:prolyl oligopeptidase family serine peptidase [Rhodophyticola sp. MJ-SS7]MDU8942304.1 prolyl oligopeptidase family serine peptidase [Rhodophyticola sp. MJ-SS7]